MPVIPVCCAAGLSGPVVGACQTIDTGLAAIGVRGPGWVDIRYPFDVVVPELGEAGFGPHDIVALFNGNVILDDLAAALRAFYPDYEPDADDETILVLAQRWRCWLPCCCVRRRRGPFAAIAARERRRRRPSLEGRPAPSISGFAVLRLGRAATPGMERERLTSILGPSI